MNMIDRHLTSGRERGKEREGRRERERERERRERRKIEGKNMCWLFTY